MTQLPETAAKDQNYDLIRVLESSLRNAWQMAVFVDDAERVGDDELAEWFRKIQHNSVKAAEQGKAMLAQRLEAPTGSSTQRDDLAERPGSSKAGHEHADKLADEWGEESFPGSDPPAHY